MNTIKLIASKISVKIAILAALLFVATASYGISPVKAALSSNAQGLAALIAVENATDGGGLAGSNDLGDLIVLGGLFPTSTNATTNARDLTGLIAVSNATNGGGLGGDNSLGELIILNNLFLDPFCSDYQC